MAWMTLREALEMAAASGFDAGEGAVDAASRRPKKTRGMARAKLVREIEVDEPSPPRRPVLTLVWSTRCKPTHDPNRVPPRRVGFHLRLVGGRDHVAPREVAADTGRRVAVSAAFAATPSGKGSANWD